MLTEELLKDLYNNHKEETVFMISKNNVLQKICYKDFFADILVIIETLNEYKNQCIALISNNSYLWVVNFFAIILSGNKAVVIDPESTEDKLIYILQDAGCSAVLCENNQVLKSKLAKLGIVMQSNHGFLKGSTKYSQNKESVNYNIVIYTSGSSSEQKGVKLSSDGILLNAISICKRIKFEEGIFLALPLHHAYPMTIALFVTLYCKNWVYISGKQFGLGEVERANTKAILAVPAIVEFIINHINEQEHQEKRRLGIVHQIICGGAPLQEKDVLRCLQNGLDLVVGYGMTECGCVISADHTNLERHYSVGRALDCYEVRIDNQQENGCGEITVRGNALMKGYINHEPTSILPTEFFRTGDVGFIDKDGYLYIKGRLKSLIVFKNGKKVAPEELEKIIKNIDHVNDAVVSLYEGEKKEYLVSVIDLDEQSNESYVYEQIMVLNEKLPFYSRIEKVILGNHELKRTSLNKVRRSEVNQYIENKIIPKSILEILESASGIAVILHFKRCSILHIKRSRCGMTRNKRVTLYTAVSSK